MAELKWNSFYIKSIGFTLSDGNNFQAGSAEFTNCHKFDPTKKITRVETVINHHESAII